MANFRESAVTGTKWSRCRGINIQNSYGQTPSITLQEETLVLIDGTTQNMSGRNLNVEFNPAAVITLRNPVTDVLTGTTITQGEVYAILYSLYRQAAEA